MTFAAIALATVVGFVVGQLYFHWLERQLAVWTAGGGRSLWARYLVLRIAVVVIAFWAIAHLGPLPLLAAAAAFLVARQRAISSVRTGP